MRNILVISLILFCSIFAFSQKDTLTTKSGLKYIQLKPGNGKTPVDGQKLKVF